MSKKITAETYSDEAEKLLRELAPQKGLTVWRGKFDGFIPKGDEKYIRGDMVVVGLKNTDGDRNKNPDESLSVLFTYLLKYDNTYCVMIYIENDDTTKSGSTPFDGGWNPIVELEKEFEKLPDFS